VGHPLLDAIEQTGSEDIASFRSLHATDSRPIIAILPGSRKQEIRRILPIMLSVVRQFTDYQFVVAGLSTLSPAFYHRIIASRPVKIVYDQTYALLKSASAALVTSGTATLETALLGVPQIICYRGETLSYLIARKLVKVYYIGLVNLIMEKEIVKELIQSNLNTDNLVSELHQILEGGNRRSQMLLDYQEMKLKLGGKGASAGAANLICRYLQEIS
jgi:lipid-A-disaccharide synthase